MTMLLWQVLAVTLATVEIVSAGIVQTSPLRLRSMCRLSCAFAVLAVCSGPWGIAIGLISAVLAHGHNDLRLRPSAPAYLLLTGPAAVVFLWSMVFPLFPHLPKQAGGAGGDAAAWIMLTAPFVLGLAAIAFSAPQSAWRRKVAAVVAASLWSCVTLIALQGASPWPWLILALPLGYAFVHAPEDREESAAVLRVAAASAMLMWPLTPATALAGAWTLKEDESLTIIRAPFGGGRDRDLAVTGFQSYSENGLTDDVTLVAAATQESFGPRARTGGMAGLRVHVWTEDAWTFSIEGLAGIEPVTLADAVRDLDGHMQGEVKLLAGWSGEAGGFPVYATAEVAQTFRPERLGDATMVAIGGGIRVLDDVQANVHLSLTREPFGPDQIFVQAGVLWSLDEHFGLELGVQSHALAADDVRAYAGLWVRF